MQFNKLKKFEVKKYNTKMRKKLQKNYNLSIKNLKCKVYVIKKNKYGNCVN